MVPGCIWSWTRPEPGAGYCSISPAGVDERWALEALERSAWPRRVRRDDGQEVVEEASIAVLLEEGGHYVWSVDVLLGSADAPSHDCAATVERAIARKLGGIPRADGATLWPLRTDLTQARQTSSQVCFEDERSATTSLQPPRAAAAMERSCRRLGVSR
jgi:hypothetical protein